MLIYNTETRFYKTIQAYGDTLGKIQDFIVLDGKVKPYPIFKQATKRLFTQNGFTETKISCSIIHVTTEQERQIISFIKILARESEIYINGERVTS